MQQPDPEVMSLRDLSFPSKGFALLWRPLSPASNEGRLPVQVKKGRASGRTP